MKNIELPPSIRFRQNPELLIQLFHHAQFLKSDIHPETFRRMTRAIKACSVAQYKQKKTGDCFLKY